MHEPRQGQAERAAPRRLAAPPRGGHNVGGRRRRCARGRRRRRGALSAEYAKLLAAKAGGELPDGGMGAQMLGEALEVFRAHDADADGVLQFHEFAAVMQELGRRGGEQFDMVHLRAAFHKARAAH